jgi:hypothetical protein
METRDMPYADLASQEGMTKWKLLNMIAHEGIRPSMPPAGVMNVELRKLIDSCLISEPGRRPSMEQVLARLQGSVRKSVEADALSQHHTQHKHRTSMLSDPQAHGGAAQQAAAL